MYNQVKSCTKYGRPDHYETYSVSSLKKSKHSQHYFIGQWCARSTYGFKLQEGRHATTTIYYGNRSIQIPEGVLSHCTWMCLPNIKNGNFSIPIFRTISDPLLYNFLKKNIDHDKRDSSNKPRN